jgi:hypothetical protein
VDEQLSWWKLNFAYFAIGLVPEGTVLSRTHNIGISYVRGECHHGRIYYYVGWTSWRRMLVLDSSLFVVVFYGIVKVRVQVL